MRAVEWIDDDVPSVQSYGDVLEQRGYPRRVRSWAITVACAGSRSRLRRPRPRRNDVLLLSPRVVTLDGKQLSLAKFRGKPVFINVWSSW